MSAIGKNTLERFNITRFQVTIEFKKEVNFTFFHGAKIYFLLSKLFDRHPLGKDFVISLPESGRINYKRGSTYNFGIIVLRNVPEFELLLKEKLLSSDKIESFNDGLLGSFRLVNIEKLPEIKFPPNIQKLIQSPIVIQFVSPLRMLRKEPSADGKRYFDPDFFDFDRFFELLYLRINKDLLGYTIPKEGIPKYPKSELKNKTLLWVDMPYSDGKKTLGGIIGKVEFKAELEPLWKELLWLGEYVHVGNNTSFGFGEYRILSLHNINQHVRPSKTFLDYALESENLFTAFQNVKSNAGNEGIDNQKIDEFEKNLFDNLKELNVSIQNKKYKPDDLLGIILPKDSRKIRALAIPTVRDRIAQRAVIQAVGETVDHLLEESSFAYRKGLSRIGAAKAINKAYEEGFRYILESDIEAFFDNVDWKLLFDKLEALFYDDPILPLIKDWVKQSVIFQGQKIIREKGLPQGSPISPLLANLFLDEFDESLGDNFKLIRYADDFVVLCKSREEAESALNDAIASLEKLKLQLKKSKTSITDFEQGFQYLGYLFLKSLVIESEKEEKLKPSMKAVISNLDSFEISPSSWIAKVDIERLRRLKTKRESVPEDELKKAGLIYDEKTIPEKFPVYITDPDISLLLEKDAIVIDDPKAQSVEPIRRRRIPLSRIHSVVTFGNSRLTLPAILRLSQNSIPIYFCSHDGKLITYLPIQEKDYTLWLKQVELANDENFRLKFSKSIVEAKIHNALVLAKRYEWDEEIISQLNVFKNKCQTAENLEALLGYEGTSAASFFKGFGSSLSDEFQFTVRTKNPPLDPVNSLLSFGYSLLYNHISTAIQICGLNPEIGWYHSIKPGHLSLASDLVEEFRHIIEGLVLYIIHRNIVTREDFTFNETEKYPCLMKKDFKKKFIEMVEDRLQTNITYKEKGDKINYFQVFHLKVKLIKAIANNPDMEYEAFRTR
jgi:CRISPR-associated protein Cas1